MNYTQLSKLDAKYKDAPFTIVGFPSRDFRKQEYADPAKIKEFVKQYDVKFPLMELCHVNGKKETIPIYRYLKNKKKGLLGTTSIKWNFTKFLIDSNGQPLTRYSPQKKPFSIEPDIIKALGDNYTKDSVKDQSESKE